MALLAIMQAGEDVEEVIAQHRDDIDEKMLRVGPGCCGLYACIGCCSDLQQSRLRSIGLATLRLN